MLIRMKCYLWTMVLVLIHSMCGSLTVATSHSLRRRRLDEGADTSSRDADDYAIQMAEKRRGKGRKKSDDDGGGGGGGSSGGGASNKKGGGKGGKGSKGGGGGKGGDRAGKWKQNFELLQNYHSVKGTAMVPLDYEDGDVKLGRWLRAIQKAWRDGKLPPEKVDQLKALGLESQPSASGQKSGKDNMAALKEGSKDRFQEFTAALVEYKRSNGHLQVPRSFVTEGGGVDEEGTTVGGGLKLGAWLAVHLTRAHHGGLDEGRHKELRKLFAQLGGDFDAASEKFAAIEKGAGKSGNGKGGKGGKGARKTSEGSANSAETSERSDD